MSLLDTMKRFINHQSVKLDEAEKASEDPKIQLIQATRVEQEQHNAVLASAANVMAAKTRAEQKLNDALAEHDATDKLLEDALRQQDEATKAGNTVLATEKGDAARIASQRLTDLEAKIETQKQTLLQANDSAEQAKKAVDASKAHIQEQLGKIAQSSANLDQAKMKEELNKELTQLNSAVTSESVMTVDEVDDKINQRLAKAGAMNDISGSSDEMKLMDVQRQAREVQADDRLAEKRKQMGLTEEDTTKQDTTKQDA